nr:hypothetical protein [Phytohabitans rumicis]
MQLLGTLTRIHGRQEQHAELVDLTQASGDEVVHLGVEQQRFEGPDAFQQGVHAPGAPAVETVVAPVGPAQKVVRVVAGRGELRVGQQRAQHHEAMVLQRSKS